ncbi:Serine/threonine-protein kinase tel1, partial [Ceratobasidium sp. 395]
MSQELSNALELLVGKTIRDRAEGMRLLQDLLKRDSVVASVDEKGDGKAWLYIFQKVFPLVLDERDKYMKASADKSSKRTGADAGARLEKAAGFVRWLTERSVTHLNRRVVKPLMTHLTQMIVHNGAVFTPVALSYVKALRTVVGFRPHLDYLDPDTWSHLLALSFAVVLGDRLSHKLTLEDLMDDADRGNRIHGDSGDEEVIASPSKKRRRIMSPPAPLIASSSSGSLKSVRLDQIEFVALIRALLSHPNASFMITSVAGASRAVLNSLQRYFVEYPAEGTAHQDAIWALNSALVHLELNRSRELVAFGAKLWSPLLDLWSTKVRPVKEGLVLAFTILMPLMMENDDLHFQKADSLARLNAALDGEPDNRSGLEGLSLDVLRLHLVHDGSDHGAFQANSFQYGADFSASHALSWVALQLQADCIAKSLLFVGSVRDTPRRGGKSLRLSNPVLSLLSLIKAVPSTRNYRLQVLLFLIERHWMEFSATIQSEICTTLSSFLSQDDHISASWAFTCCAAIACVDRSPNPSTTSPVVNDIGIFWNHAIRRISVALECRAACHAAHAIARSGHLDNQTLYRDIETFATDLLVQGPAFPHDSVCAFLVECLRFASRDVRLFRKQLEDKVLGWLSETWNVTEIVRNGVRNRLDTHYPADVLELLQTSCGLARWTPEERAVVLLAFDTIIDNGEDDVEHTPWHGILDPDVDTGIKRRALAQMMRRDVSTTKEHQDLRRGLLRNIWQWGDVQLAFADLSAFLRRSIHDIKPTVSGEGKLSASQVDADGFSEIRTASSEPTIRAADNWTVSRISQALISFATRFLTATPMLQSSNLEPTRDRSLLEFLQSCDGLAFITLAPEVFECIRRRYLHMSTSSLESMLDHLGDLLKSYGHPRCEKIQLILLAFLECVMPLWTKPADIDKDYSVQSRVLLHWFSEMLVTQKVHSWKSRDRLTVLMESYLAIDPQQSIWSVSSSDDSDSVSPEYLPGTIRYMESVLVAVSDRMGLTNLSQLFEAYASQIAFSTVLAKKDFAHIPSHILGYKSSRERIEESFKFVGPTLLLSEGLREPVSHGINQFRSLCKSIGISEPEGLRNCFHDVIGLSIVFYHEESLDNNAHFLSQEATTDLKDVVLKRTSEACPPEELPQDYLSRIAPLVVVSIVRTINGAPDEDIIGAFRQQGKASAAKDFETFQYYWGDDDFPVHDPVLPAFAPQTVVASLFWFLESQSNLFVESHLAYHVVHRLFISINRSPLVNEQLRLLRALSIVVASLKHFRKDWILLRTLIHGYSLLLTQPDLARMAQSALDWCLTFIPKHITAITSGTPRLEVLGRMGRIAYDYTRETDTFMHNLGDKLMDWVEGVTARLEKEASKSDESQKLHPEILNVLALWPRQLKYPELASRAEELDSENMSFILQHYASNASKFRTVHRLLSIANSDDARLSAFAKADFWNLKSCIPSEDQLQNEDAAAFTALLFAYKGIIAALTSDQHDDHSVDSIHRAHAAKSKRDSTPPLLAILVVLFDLVYSEDSSKVFTAYQTIGRLASLDVDTASFPGTPSTSRSVQQERTFFTRHVEVVLTVEPRSIEELSTAEDIKAASTDYSKWVRTMGSYFCALLSSINGQEYFAQLVDIIHMDDVLAKQLLPVLIHAILQHEEYQLGAAKFKHDERSARAYISSYLTGILVQESVSTAIVGCVIQIVLHLRNFHPLSPTEPRDWLSYNQWLDIDHRLLSEGALRCGAYTTAILFLELYQDRPHDFTDSHITRSTEEVLYDIYTHIDEPDGFYGIRSDDVQTHLIRRFHHEGRWDKAFQFLGAMFESPGTSASSVP